MASVYTEFWKRWGKNSIEIISEAMATEMKRRESAIKNATGRGKDYLGNDFKPYTAEYREFKNNLGTKRNVKKQARGETVNLRLSGDMLQSISSSVVVQGSQVTGIIQPTADQAIKAKANNETRPFLALSPDAIDKVRKAIIKALNNQNK